MSKLIRKEVHIQEGTVERLKLLADKKGWSVKQVMEELIMAGSIIAEKNLRGKNAGALL